LTSVIDVALTLETMPKSMEMSTINDKKFLFIFSSFAQPFNQIQMKDWVRGFDL
jgi:hypothetical protein